MRMNMTGLAGALALCALTTSASAATMTFSDFGPEMIGADSYTEDGITVTGNSGLGDYGPGHIDAQNSPAPSLMTFTMKGIFDAISFDITPWGFDYFTCKKDNCTTKTYKNVSVKGYQGETVVAELLFNMGEGTAAYTVLLGEKFVGLTSLVIQALVPINKKGNVGDCSDVCSHFDVGNIELAAVPVAPALPLTASALALLGLMGLRKRRA